MSVSVRDHGQSLGRPDLHSKDLDSDLNMKFQALGADAINPQSQTHRSLSLVTTPFHSLPAHVWGTRRC